MLEIRELWISCIFEYFSLNTAFFRWGFRFLLVFVNFVGGVCFSIYYACLLLCLLLVCWVRENFSGGPGHIFCVGLRCVEWRAGTIYLSASLEWMARLYIFFLLSGSVVAGTVRLKWWTGVLFILFSSFCC